MSYGLEVRNTSNTTILDPSTRVGQLVVSGDTAVTTSGVTISAPGVTTTNSSEFAIIVKPYMTSGYGGQFAVSITRGTNQFTLSTSTNISSLRAAYFVMRF